MLMSLYTASIYLLCWFCYFHWYGVGVTELTVTELNSTICCHEHSFHLLESEWADIACKY